MTARLLLISAFLSLAACASLAPQTEEVLRSRPDVPPQERVKDIPFYGQSAGYCGPSSLAMMMSWAGSNITPEQIAPEVYTPGKKGTLQMDLVSASRRHGLMAVPVETLGALITEVAHGRPVLVLQNLALSWYPKWHYAVVTGYDLSRQRVFLHSGNESNQKTDLRVFEHSWRLGDYWGLVILQPNELAASAGELPHMQAAAGLEQAGRLKEAELAYATILNRWPDSVGARIGLANIAYKNNNVRGAVKYLREAVKLDPRSQTARHNLSVAESSLR